MSQTWKEKIAAMRASGIEFGLETLIALARTHYMTPEEEEMQRKSWVVQEILSSNPQMRKNRAEALYDEAKKKYGL